MAINDEKGLLVTVTANGGLLQNHTALRNLLWSADVAVVAIGVAHSAAAQRNDLGLPEMVTLPTRAV